MTAVVTRTGALSDRLTARRLQARMVKVVAQPGVRCATTAFRKERSQGLSGMQGNLHVPFLGGWVGAIPPGYPADEETCPKGKCVLSLPNPWSDGTTGITLAPLELLEKLAALVPLPHVHLVRYSGCLAPHSHLRGSVIPTPRQQGLDGEEVHTGTPYWPWARLLGRVFGLEMAPCPFCRRGTLRIMAVITQGEVISKILRHLKLAADPPPIAPARGHHALFTFD